jgi:hypothetical protein
MCLFKCYLTSLAQIQTAKPPLQASKTICRFLIKNQEVLLRRRNQEVLLRGRISTVDLLVLTSLDQLIFYIENIIYIVTKQAMLMGDQLY